MTSVLVLLVVRTERNKAGNVRINEATLRRVRVTTVTVQKQCVTYSECVSVAVGIQHAKRMRRIILSSVACLAVPYFSSSHKGAIFGKNFLNTKYVF
jgi:hypothetical protein